MAASSCMDMGPCGVSRFISPFVLRSLTASRAAPPIASRAAASSALPFSWDAGVAAATAFCLGLRNGVVDRGDLAERRERRIVGLLVAEHDEGEALGLYVLFGHARDVGTRYRIELRAVLLEKVFGVAEILVGHEALDDLAGGIEVEGGALEQAVLGTFQLG